MAAPLHERTFGHGFGIPPVPCPLFYAVSGNAESSEGGIFGRLPSGRRGSAPSARLQNRRKSGRFAKI
ncbi:MAG: hypothetical protein C6W56_14465 [Caldibacillus debilis]|nr:MAG: hypothetical protein BAA03_09945 [Caldibacillus debilis]REJ24400.1 MAG: hypothetical protein C6W56_14465 [Caldibacillus debilis]